MSAAWIDVAADAPSVDVEAWRRDLLAAVAGGERLVSLFGRPDDDDHARLTAVTQGTDLALAVRRVRLPREPGLRSLVGDLPAAHIFERELHEQLGLAVRGHPWLKPVRFERADVDDHPFLQMAGKQVHEVQVGPIHAGVIEPGAFRFLCHGEVVHHLEIQLGYQHRGVEAKLLATDPFRAGPLVEVVAGDTSVAHAWAWAAALEALTGRSASATALAARELMLELERVAMHLAGLSGLALDIGALQGATTWQRLRTTVINTSMALCGSRFGRTAVRPGGSGVAWDEGLRDRILGELAAVEVDHARIADHFLGDAITRHRFVGCGAVQARDAVALGLVGPAARACGLSTDLRAGPGFTPVARASGDVMARAEVRALEVPESLGRIRRILGACPTAVREGSTPTPLRPGRLVVSAVEGWRGEVVHALETGAEGQVVHWKVQDPSLRNWAGLALALRGEDISDFPINNKSFDLSYCGNDL